MHDLGRRYFLFSGSARGKQRIARIVLAAALVLQLVGFVLDGRAGIDRSLLHGLMGFSLGLLLVATVVLYLARRSS